MSYRPILWLAQQASRSKKAKNFFNMLKDPKKKARFLEKTKESKAYNRLKALKQKTGQEFMDFQKTGKIQKKLAGGLLNPLIRIGLRTKGYQGFSKQVKSYLKDLVKIHKKDPALIKLEGKRLKIDAIKGSLSKARKDMSKNLFVRKHYFGASSQVSDYQKKLKAVTKAYMHRRANPQIKTHSEGGEIVIGKNVDKDLL